MFVSAAVVSALLAVAFLGGGMMKLTHRPQAVATITHVGAGGLLPLIGVLELAGATGLAIGLVVAPLGVAAAIGLAVMMGLAFAMHLRVGDQLMACLGPILLGALAVSAATLRALSA